MTASLTVRQQAFRQVKRENDEINRWGRLGDGPPTTVMAVARRQLTAAVQTVAGGVVRIHIAGEGGSAGEKHRERRRTSISATSVLYLTCCANRTACLSRE